jgi:DNA-binding transcriptional MerR regulator
MTRLDLAGVSTVEAVQLTGATFRQLDHWERRGVLTPSIAEAHGPGTRRVYSPHDVQIAAVLVRIGALLGTSLDQRRAVVEAMRAEPDNRFLIIDQQGVVSTYPTLADVGRHISTEQFAMFTLVAVDVLLAAA